MIVSSTKRGPMRVTLEAYGGALALFTPAGRNKAVKVSLLESGNMWIYKWMPLRFTRYAYLLRYRVTTAWKNMKTRFGGSDRPFVGLTPAGGGPGHPTWKSAKINPNGEKMIRAAMAGRRVKAIGIAGRERIDILVPYGHPIQTDKSEAFTRLPQHEIDDMATVFARRLGNEISGATTTMRGGMPRLVGGGAKPRRVA